MYSGVKPVASFPGEISGVYNTRSVFFPGFFFSPSRSSLLEFFVDLLFFPGKVY